jgi:hypothetical protein
MSETNGNGNHAPLDLASAEELLETARARLSALRDEERYMPGTMQIAAEAGDVEQLVRLRLRQQEISAHVFAADVGVRRARISVLMAKKAEASTLHQQAKAEISARAQLLRAQIEEAQRELHRLELAFRTLMQEETSTWGTVADIIGELDREKKALHLFIAKQTGTYVEPSEATEMNENGRAILGDRPFEDPVARARLLQPLGRSR